MPAAGIPAAPADVELRVQVKAREVRIEQEGPITVRLRAEPGDTDIQVERSHPAGASRYRNLAINARLAAWLTQDPAVQADIATQGSTGEPQ